MARETRRAPLLLSDDRQMLTELSGSRTAPAREVERAKVLLRYADGISISDISTASGRVPPEYLQMHRQSAFCRGQVGLKDTFHSPKEPEIRADAKAWVVNLACTKPKDHGLAAELWTLSALVRQVRKCAVEAGFPRLAEVGKTTVWRILNEQNIKPHRCACRDAQIRHFTPKLPAEERKAAATCADYLLKYREMLDYDVYLAQGFPIATGVIEGACRHLVKDRMDITGARWRLTSAENA